MTGPGAQQNNHKFSHRSPIADSAEGRFSGNFSHQSSLEGNPIPIGPQDVWHSPCFIKLINFHPEVGLMQNFQSKNASTNMRSLFVML